MKNTSLIPQELGAQLIDVHGLLAELPVRLGANFRGRTRRHPPSVHSLGDARQSISGVSFILDRVRAIRAGERFLGQRLAGLRGQFGHRNPQQKTPHEGGVAGIKKPAQGGLGLE
jgi:hypothetical protein